MPPKKKSTKTKPADDSEAENMGEDSMSNMGEDSKKSSLEAFLDDRLKQQTVQLNELFLKFSKSTKADLDEIKKSQEFLGGKFDDLVKEVKELHLENDNLRSSNTQLSEQVKRLEKSVLVSEGEVEQLKQYIRRDMLEIHGVPITEDENTNLIVQKVVELADPLMTFEQSEISISHRLPSRQGQIPPIIVKFVRRDMRDKIYKMRRGLSSKTALHLGYHLESRLFINESLTQQSRALLRAAKAFKRDHHYKFVWTKYGKILLKKEATPSSEVLSFSSLKEFEDFEAKVNER